jgi:hypothetical protein
MLINILQFLRLLRGKGDQKLKEFADVFQSHKINKNYTNPKCAFLHKEKQKIKFYYLIIGY